MSIRMQCTRDSILERFQRLPGMQEELAAPGRCTEIQSRRALDLGSSGNSLRLGDAGEQLRPKGAGLHPVAGLFCQGNGGLQLHEGMVPNLSRLDVVLLLQSNLQRRRGS